MWQDLVTVQIPVLEKIARTVLVYALIVLVFRVIGKSAIDTGTDITHRRLSRHRTRRR